MNFHQIVREPLLHFLLIGLALFLLYAVANPGESSGRTVMVSQGQIDEMRRQYQALWGRPPDKQQLAALIESHVRDEILYREGEAQGLGRNDPVIKRRIRQKIEVMAEEENNDVAPTEAVLSAYLQRHGARFMKPAVVSFDQVYFDPQGPDTPATVAAAKARLAAGASPRDFGQPSMAPARVTAADADIVARDFGAAFATTLVTLPIGQWQGPLASGIGVHLVKLTALVPPVAPPLAEVRAAVQREWENERRVAASEASYARARARYDVVIEGKP